MAIKTCRPRRLTPTQAARATRRSLEVNPANAIEMVDGAPARRGGPRRLAVLVGNRWPTGGVRLSVQFLDTPPVALRKRILAHMNAWSERADVSFVETRGVGEVRIARLDDPPADAGYWSYLGTEILGIEDEAPTMNLEGFTLRTPEAEFRRVVRHETGHTLGFEHEHLRTDFVQRIDRRKAIAYYRRTQGWSADETIAQVLTPLAEASIFGSTESDPDSIMCYQVPGTITRDGRAIRGGSDFSPTDLAFAARVYPKPKSKPKPRRAAVSAHAPGPATTADDEPLHLVVMDAFVPQPGARAARESFARVFASWGGARVSGAMRLRAAPGEPPTRFGRIIRVHERIRNYTDRGRGALPAEGELVGFGSDLFETLIDGDVRRLYDEARARRAGRPLDLVFTSMIPWIAEKPWEFAHDPARGFLATSAVHFVRNVLTAVPADPVDLRTGALRILVACAQPVGFGALSAAQETAVVRRGFDALTDAGHAVVEVETRISPERLHQRLRDGAFDVVHFIGHGRFDEATQEGALLFEGEDGRAVALGGRALVELFCHRGLALVFLNACQSGSGGRADFNRGAAQSLVAHGLPALVANQYSVLDASATVFARQFYAALAQGIAVGPAAREARIAVGLGLRGEAIDWAVPVVYARDPGLVLCASPAAATPEVPRARRRSAAQDAARRIAVWDIDGAFPMLDDLLARLGAAQARFVFERVDLTLPLDAWESVRGGGDERPRLDPARLARRVAGAASASGAALLLGLTRHRLRDGSAHPELWWPAGRDPAVALAALDGYPRLPPAGPATRVALARRIVAALAGHFGDRSLHVGGAAACPLHADPRRRASLIEAPARFDARCRAPLKRDHPADLRALDAILSAFH